MEGQGAEREVKQTDQVDTIVYGEVKVPCKCEEHVCRGDLVFDHLFGATALFCYVTHACYDRLLAVSKSVRSTEYGLT